ncbi:MULTISPECIES: hypothetical protein [Sphingomonas]|uniref:hypothetical protein n=1 Tax=Sphingomonas TaxID=13687 RepID=UPI002413AAB7|nr:hypothetical protein [Sphingomonas echinoides]
MSTPFDATLRLRQREMDAMQVSISVEVNQLAVIEQTRTAIDRSVRHEAQVAATEWACSAHAFVARMRAQRAGLLHERASVDARLTRLRSEAAEAYGALRAIAGAADRYRAEADRVAASAEQERIDDFSAARFTHRQAAIRRSRDEGGRET